MADVALHHILRNLSGFRYNDEGYKVFDSGSYVLAYDSAGHLLFLYYYYLFSDDMLANILPHTMERNRDGYTLWMYKKLVLRDTDDDGAEKTKWMVCGRISVMDASVIKTRKCFNYTVLYLEDAPMSVLYVPTNDLLEQNYENT